MSRHARGVLEHRVRESRIDVAVRRSESYGISVYPGALDRLGAELEEVLGDVDARALVLVTDENVARLYLERAVSALGRTARRIETVVVPAGEGTKAADSVQHLWGRFRDLGVDRRTLVVALGGGVVCDLVGFAAQTYMRGLPYVNVPTSLIAQADAAVGGKVGIDHHGVKNLVGGFHHPVAVVVDPTVLGTLPPRDVRGGAAEVFKVGVLGAPELAERLPEVVDRLLAGETGDSLRALVAGAIAVKLRLLSEDPFETGSLRRLLNYGHCIGHPVESASRFTLSHGEAVAIGMASAGRVALRLGLCSPGIVEQVEKALTAVGLPTCMREEWAEATWQSMRDVKRARNGVLNLVYPVAYGSCLILEDVGREDLLPSVCPDLAAYG